MMLKFIACATLLPAAAAEPSSITGYQAATDVRQHSLIDLDQKELEGFLKATPPDYAQAKTIYENGKHSIRTVALTVVALTADIPQGTEVTQGVAKGKLTTPAAVGATSITLSYTSTCEVADPSGCFQPTAGEVPVTSVGATSKVDNTYRTLASFSTDAESKMKGQEYYAAFHAFYKKGDYGDGVVQDGLGKTGELADGDAAARDQFIKKGTVYLNVWMHVIGEMERAIIACSKNSDDGVGHWDEAVAFYSGSQDGSAGNLLYRFALKRCGNFGTCGDSKQGVNTEIIPQFTLGQKALKDKKCSEAITIKRKIVEIMSVPMVQGTLRYAWKLGVAKGDRVSKESAEGLTFTKGIMPLVAACDSKAAEIIRQNTVVGKRDHNSKSWTDVKKALESTYACLGVTCEQVNGLVQGDAESGSDCKTKDKGDGTFCKEADPCSDSAPGPSPTPTAPVTSGLRWWMIPLAVVVAVAGTYQMTFVPKHGGAAGNQQELVSA